MRGRTDCLRDEQAGCSVENVVSPPELVPAGEMVKFPGGNELYSEEASPLADALAALCARAYPSPRLCGREAVCGDQSCSGDESFARCPGDCGEAPPPRERPSARDAGIQLPPLEPDAAQAARMREGDSCSLRQRRARGAGVWLFALSLVLVSRRRFRWC